MEDCLAICGNVQVLGDLLLCMDLLVTLWEEWERARGGAAEYLVVGFEEAKRLLSIFLAEGDAAALNLLGVFYHDGQGLPKDDAKAARLFTLTSERGCARGLLNLGECFYSGHGVKQSRWNAEYYFRRAGKKGNIMAPFCLSMMIDDDAQRADETRDAVDYLRAGAELGDSCAQCALGWWHYVGERDDEYGPPFSCQPNYKEAARMFHLAVDNPLGEKETQASHISKFGREWNKANAELGLAMCYGHALGVANDEEKCVALIKNAASRGCSRAQVTLGCKYEFGTLGFPQDYGEAIRLYEIAMESSEPIAMERLSQIYLGGQGVPYDFAKSMELQQAAAEESQFRRRTYSRLLRARENYW
eukprot:TRINITY_DN39574_c0_g1_i1.p1 TRINITY_DN39574_c0_g1~~TRINITY_DN39574_c0_g1_i1.p1  ORF type:complete len:360 (-),score=45.92 TRINITY_DN39574_c0_g1_i1:126-1205(-)